MDIEKVQKDHRKEILEIKICFPDFKIIEELNKQVLNKKSSKRKGDRIMDKLNNSPINHKCKKKQKTIMTYL